MKALILISDRADPATSGSKVRNLHLWRALSAEGVELKILGIDLNPADKALVPGFPTRGFRYERQALPLRALNSLLYSYHQWPYSHALQEATDQEIKAWQPDIIHAEEMRMAAYLPALRRLSGKAKQTVTFHNVESELVKKTGSTAFRFGKPLIEKAHLINLERYERKILAHTNLCFAYSPVDKSIYQGKYPNCGNWETTSGGVNLVSGSFAEQTDLRHVLIAGSLQYQPNVKGLHWFIREVIPHLAQGIRVTVAGSNASSDLKNLIGQQGFHFIDTPKDLSPLYRDSAISLVPLLTGSGTRGRILESIGLGRVTVTTSIGAEGLALQDGDGIVIADDPMKFATAINMLLPQREKRVQIAKRGYACLEGAYDWPTVARNMKRCWETLL